MSNIANKTPFSSLTLVFSKTPIHLKFNNYSNYFFLTNNLMLINNYYFFHFFNTNWENLKKINYSITIKRNNYFLLKNFLKFRKYTKLSIHLNRFSFKFNTLFKLIFINKFKKIRKNLNFLISFIASNTININRYYMKRFYKNWQILIGKFISPHYITLFSKKKWLRKNKNFYFFSNRFFNKHKFKRRFKFFIKKHAINNFFYLNKSTNFNNYSLLPFLIKNNVNYSIMRKNNYDFFLTRPYIFLNNPKINRHFKKYPNFMLISFYKKYSKFFSRLRRVNISNRIRTKHSFIFKNFLSYFGVLFKNNRSRLFKNSKANFNWFSFFNTNKKRFSYLTKKSLKKQASYFYRFFFFFKTKIFKKNKFSVLNKFYLNRNAEMLKFSRRVKKGNLYFKTIKSRKKLSFLFFTKINWSAEFFFLSFKYFSFFNNFLFSLKKNFLNFIWRNPLFNFFKNKNIFFNFKKLNKFKSRILLKSRKPFFVSKNKTNFILTKYAFIFINNFYILSLNTNFFYNFKKTMFSFSYKNELQRYILRKYSRMTFSVNFNTLQSNKFFFNKAAFFSSKNLSPNSSYLDAFLIKKNEFYTLLLQNTANKLNWPYFNNQVAFAFNSENEQVNFNIKRVKFKPGYMNTWREARLVLKSSLMLKMKYQYKLTNYLSKYKKFINFKTFLFMEMRLSNILIKSRLFNDSAILSLFLKNNLIYLNGLICSNANLQIFSGDFIQLIINLKYYILYRWFSNLSLKKKNKLKNVLRKKNNNFNQSDEKKRSYSFPKWIFYSKNSIDDVSNFLETDYFTLSIFVLYEPFTWNDVNTYNFIDQRFNIINLYNWKYIT